MAGLDIKPSTTAPPDRPVFVAGDDRRARRLRNAAIVVGLLAGRWVVGLGVGRLGLGRLPGVGLVKGARVDSRPDQAPHALVAAKHKSMPRSLAAHVTSTRGQSASFATVQGAATRAATERSRRAKRASRSPAVAPPPASAQ